MYRTVLFIGLAAKTDSPCLLIEQTWFQEDEKIFQHFWNKCMMNELVLNKMKKAVKQ